jgi:hypothetical protein
MILRLAAYTLIALAVSAGLWFLFEQTYEAYRFASEEARTSIAVTQEQSLELRDSARWSDLIVYAVVGATLAAMSGLLCHPNAKTSGRLRAAVIGILLGGAAGATSAILGHWFDERVLFPPEPMIYWVKRWSLMLLPIALAVAVTVASAGRFTKTVLDAVVGAAVGGALAMILYCVLSGMLTPIEGHQYIYPAATGNRLMILGLSAVFIGGTVLVHLGRSSAKPESVPESRSPHD